MEYVDFLEKIPGGHGLTENTLRLWFVMYQWVLLHGYADSADSPAFLEHVNKFRKSSTGTIATHLRQMANAGLLKRTALRRKLSQETKETLSVGALLFAPGAESTPTSFVRYTLPGHSCPTEFNSLNTAISAVEKRIKDARTPGSKNTPTETAFAVEDAMLDRFREGTAPRSPEYRHGFEAMLLRKLSGSALPNLPYATGSAQADAFLSGQDHASEYVRARIERGGPLYE